MWSLLKFLPNTLSILNGISGAISIVLVLQGNFLYAALFIFLAALLDFLDGFTARALGAMSPLGKDLDSLSDVISFGLAPAVFLYAYLRPAIHGYALLAFILLAGSIYRLAKFNVDTRQTISFMGLPTPANALFWLGLVMGLQHYNTELTVYLAIFLLCLAFFMSYMLICELPMFSLKFKHQDKKSNRLALLLIFLTLLLNILFPWLGLSLSILLYIIFAFVLRIY